MDGELKELLQRKADEVRVDAKVPAPVLRRARRRRIGNALVAGLTTAAVVAGAFVGIRTALQPNPARHNRIAQSSSPNEVWFTMSQRLFVTSVTTENTPEAVLRAMLDGPTADQTGATVSSAIPAGTELQGLSIDQGLARVQLSTAVESNPLSDAQVVYTLTQFPDVQRILINNQEGGPLTRSDLTGQLPAILLQHPAIDDTVSSPVTISGTANVFEGTVSIRIIAGEGTVVADTFTTATCGNGCRGTYSTKVDYTLAQRQTGTIEVYEVSAKDGSSTNVVRIPVTLEPSGSSGVGGTGFTGIWPIDDQSQLADLQRKAASGQAGYALQPDTAATTFASSVLHWAAGSIAVKDASTTGDQSQVTLWNHDMGSQFSSAIAENVRLQRMGTVWVVVHADSGLFDLQCPSIRQDVIVAGIGQRICGQFAQLPAGWVVHAVLMSAGSALGGSKAQRQGDIPLSGQRFDGTLPPTPNFDGADAELIVTATSGSGATLGVWARRLQMEIPSPSPSP